MAAPVNARDFVKNPECLKGKKATSRIVSDAKLWTIPLVFTDASGRTSEYGMDVDFPELKAARGIKAVDKGSYTKYEVNAALPLADASEETRFFYEEFIPALNKRIVDLIIEQGQEIYGAGKSKDPAKEKERYHMLVDEHYYNTFFMPTDKESGEEREGADPLTKLNLRDFEKSKTAFCDLDGKPLSAEGRRLQFSEVLQRLEGQGFDFVPRVNFSKIDIRATSIRAHNSIRSLVITDLYEAQSTGPDMSGTAAVYADKYTARKDALSERLRGLQAKPLPAPTNRFGALRDEGAEPPVAVVKAPAPAAAAAQVAAPAESDDAPPEQDWNIASAKPKPGGFNGKFRRNK
jgi:hypothetical protein